jgi:hypothetical protein
MNLEAKYLVKGLIPVSLFTLSHTEIPNYLIFENGRTTTPI